jgi:RHS repeat-associated protein
MAPGTSVPQDATASNSPGASPTNASQEPRTSKDAGSSQPGSSPFSAPKISLPTGGGAIRGIGEKFQANAATGTGKLTVPLNLSKGRLGFAPDLSLSHDSGSGNSVFGIGWSLSAVSITRKTDKGLPKYRRREKAECDVFILSGAEDLVSVLIQDAEGCWVEDEFELDGHCVKRYRPRIEGLFARIERWTRLDDGDEHWRSISQDNTLTIYGRDERSRIFDPQNRHHIFSWLICESYDDRGNAIVYEYAAENDDGVDLSRASEHGRIRTANRYPKRILYGNRHPLLRDDDSPGFRPSQVRPPDFGHADWMFEVVFDYGEGHYRSEPSDSNGCEYVRCTSELPDEPHWPVRRDPFSRYRSCFEIRTYRLCHRVLMFHHFPEELRSRDYLVRSTEFTYRQKPLGSFITQIKQSGYVRQEDGRYLKRSMPPLDLDYTSSPLENEGYRHFEVKEVDPVSLQNLPAGIDDERFRWVDLNGEGISGVLSEQGTAWFYKPNAGQGRFRPTELVAEKPSLAALNSGRQQLLDVAGAGTLNLVQFDGSTPGFFERTLDDGWGCFRTFRSLPVLDWKDPNLRFVDITGDGIADILITEDDAFLWHESLLDEGFGSAIRVTIPTDEDRGPHVIFADGVQSIYLADMSGDGLSDLVRIRKDEVCVWHNHGYGVFGPKVVMDNVPWFDDDTLFEQWRVKLADTDGNGCADIVYLGHDGIRIYVNESGNSWSSARVLPQFFPVNRETSVSVVDFLGRGTACILWSSALPGDSTRCLRYVDLMDGQKPHLLVRIANNLGAETHVEYASSTEFYLADKAEGRPWLTRLPFPVHVVKRVETYDYVSRNRFVTSYTYHHGFFDGLEREFRGFGRVDQLDTEDFATLSQSPGFPVGDNVDRAFSVPPVLTKTWFHTGVFLGNGYVSRHLANEYYREPAPPHADGKDPLAAMLLDDTILPDFLTAMEAREACRALKGTMLRQEIYALDEKEESSRPYSVAESNATIVTLQPRGCNLHGVFFTHPRESVTFHYERKLYEVDGCRYADPRASHNLTLEVDDYGNVLKSVSIGYGRRFPDPSPLLTDADRAKQSELLLTLSENRFTNAVLESHSYRVPIPAEARAYQLVNLKPWPSQPGITNLFRFEELQIQVARASDGRHDLPNEDVNNLGATGDAPYRRLLDETRTYYRSDRLERILPLGVTGALALPGQTYKLAMTPGLLAQVYHRGESGKSLIPDVEHVLHHEGKYLDLTGSGQWWIPSGRVFYAPHECDAREELEQARRHFFQPRRFVDPFHYTTLIAYDRHDLSPVEGRDAVGNITAIEIDYRVLSPYHLTDANRNRSEVAFDALGLVVGTAVMGKMGQRAGDSLDGFQADLDEATIVEHFAHPLHAPHSILKLATTRLVYDLFAYMRTRDQQQPRPAGVYTMARETHAADLRPDHHTKIQHVFSYSDGFQRQIQKKIQAEPGPLTDGGPDVNPRWVGSGWTIYNNKGKPVRQYEPFFSARPSFEFAAIAGVSSILFYDPVDRVVATLHPNQTYDKVVFDPWRQETWDVNDTVLQNNPTADPDVGDFFAKLPESDYLPTWYEQRRHGQLGREQQQAAEKTSVHANTPTTAQLDTLGRTFLTIAHNRFERAGAPVDQYFATRVDLDIESNQRAVIDALGRVIMRYDYDMLKTRLRQISVDSGMRWMLNDALGKSLLMWDSRGHRFRHEYDALHRPTNFYVRVDHEPEFLAERMIYGEGQPNDLALNLRNKPYQQFDAAGLITNDHYDFKGNLLKSTRRLLDDYRNEVNWAKSPELDQHTYSNSTTYDALNRAITLTTPDSSVCRPKYNEANLLESLAVNLRGADDPTRFVTFINYNAKGQRTIIDYGNGSHTRYDYDPLTFRLIHLETRREKNHERLQDLHYFFDPVGNITSIRDDAQQTVYFKNQVVPSSNEYVHDAIYRLISADGREPAGKPGEPQTTYNDVPRMNHPLPSDGHALHRYREHYDYDAVGNILKLLHTARDGNWVRLYHYDEPHTRPRNNRLTRTEVGQLQERYAYDADGNMTCMPHLPGMDWDFKNQLHATRQQASHSGRGETTYYVYNSGGQRIRKVTERGSGSRKDERVYLGSFEIYRKYDSVGATTVERETLHVLDDKRRIALVETKTINDEQHFETPTPRIRYQFDNHLGSSVLELDQHASIISYEEYYPYGSTSFEAAEIASEVSKKRYRYTGKERDEETGFYYHVARYYAPWLGKWTSCDPTGLKDGPNLYQYADANPVMHTDPTGQAAGVPLPEPGLLQSAGSRLIGDYKGWNNLWNQAVNKVLGAAKEGESTIQAAERNISAFKGRIAGLKETVGMGSNRQVGTAIHEARKVYSQVRTEFGVLAERAGISLKGIQVHHGIGKTGELAQAPEKALDAGALHLAEGNAGTKGTSHNLLTEMNKNEKLAAWEAKQEAAKAAEHEAQSALKTTVSEAAKESVSTGKVVVKEMVKETAEETGKTALKEGGKVLGTKVAKFIPGLGIGVGIALVRHDLKTNDYGSAAWDAAEAIPVVGDVVGAAHVGISTGTLLNEGLGIDKVAAEHGMAAEAAAKWMGAGEDTARFAGATTAAISAITVAPTIAVKRLVSGWF